MSVRVYLSGDPVHDRVLTAFYDGCPESKTLTTLSDYQPSDVALIFGVGKRHVPISWPRGDVFQRQKSKNLSVIVLETGYLNRGDGNNHHYAAGIGGLNGRADFRNKGMPGDRAAALSVNIQPWREHGNFVLLCGQVPWDASVDFTDHKQWLTDTAAAIASATALPVLFRPHPKGPPYDVPGTTRSTAPLAEDFDLARAVVTFNSNTAVESVLYGIPTYAADIGSMAWPVTFHDLGQIAAPPTFERAQWLNDLAYTQWTPAGMAAGLAWQHLYR